MKLNQAERLVIVRIVNIQLNSATLKDHILLEGIYKALKPEKISLKTPLDFVDDDMRSLFEQYDGKPVNNIKDEKHRKIITEAIQKARVEELKVWSSKDEGEEVKLTSEQLGIINDFFERDNRPFPRENHAAIVSLHEKLTGKEDKSEEDKAKKIKSKLEVD